MRAAPELQARICAWAAERGLEVPTNPAVSPMRDVGQTLPRVPAAPATGLAARVRALLAQLQRFFAEAPVLYPALNEENWAQQR